MSALTPAGQTTASLAPAGVTLEPLSGANRADWDAFVEACPDATFFHKAGWAQVVEEVYGHRPHYWLARRNGRAAGVLPLANMRTWLSGNALVSVPYCVYGGIAADDAEVAAALAVKAEALAGEVGAEFVELRCRTPAPEEGAWADWKAKADRYATFRKAIGADHDANLKAIPRKKRADVRKSLSAGLSVDTSGDLATFYRIYASSVHRLGTPVFPRRWFQALQAAFGADTEISVVSGPSGPVAALMSFYFRDEVLPYYGGALDAARELHAYDHMYWSQMCRAADRGARLYDFGRSKVGTGAYDYKTYWGFEAQPLPYRFRLVRRADVPDVNPLNPKYRRMTEIWKRLPLPLANMLGPHLARHLG